MENYHIKRHEDHWDLTKQGAAHAAISKPTKAEAIAAMEDFVKGKVVSVKIHLQNGEIEEERTYPRSADPKSSPG